MLEGNRRARQINTTVGPRGPSGPVVYVMSRDQRVADNWALLSAQSLAGEIGTTLQVVALLVPGVRPGARRHFEFKVRGLEEVEVALQKYNIPFTLLIGNDSFEVLKRSLEVTQPSAVVYDFNPLRVSAECVQQLGAYLEKQGVPLYQVDAHNIVPAWVASPKLEIGARTLRPKIHRLMPEFLTAYPKLAVQKLPTENALPPTNWTRVRKEAKVDETVPAVDWIAPGEKAAKQALKKFLEERLPGYAVKRNDPTLDHQSDLSPYLHFGQLSAQRIALEVIASRAPQVDKDAYLEELIVRRELADNFVLYNAA